MLNKLKTHTYFTSLTTSLPGGISVLQLFGKNSCEILRNIFVPKRGLTLHKIPNWKLVYGIIRNSSGQPIDEVIVKKLPQNDILYLPNSFHICCHGGEFSLKSITKVLKTCGARPASPKMLASYLLLNRKLSKEQSQTLVSPGKALSPLSSAFLLYQMISPLAAKSLVPNKKIRNSLLEPPEIAVAGAVNTGKSTLVNLLASKEVSLASPIPGTTRDTVSKSVSLDGFPFIITDTAGKVKSKKQYLAKMTRKAAVSVVNKADLILFLYDLSRTRPSLSFSYLLPNKLLLRKTILVGNKLDKVKNKKDMIAPKQMNLCPHVFISAKTGEGMDKLKDQIFKTLKIPIADLKKNLL